MATGNMIGTFFEKEEGRTYVVNEGNVTVTTGYSSLNGNKQKFFNFQNPVGAEDFVEFDLGNGKELQIKGATSEATHITQYEPEFPSGALPTENITDGSYQRYVTAFRLTVGEIQLPLSATNSAITAGDYLVVDTYSKGVDKYAGTTASKKTVIALESKTANEGGYIICELTQPSVPFA